MSKAVVGLIAGGAATAVVGAGGYLAYNQLSQPNTGDVTVQQANTNTNPTRSIKSELLGTWVQTFKTDDPDNPKNKIEFTEDEVITYTEVVTYTDEEVPQKKKHTETEKGKYRILCGQFLELKDGKSEAVSIAKFTIEGDELTFAGRTKDLDKTYKRESRNTAANTSTDTADSNTEEVTLNQKDLVGTWIDTEKPEFKYVFTEDKMTVYKNDQQTFEQKYKIPCGQILESTDERGFIRLSKVMIEGNELTIDRNGETGKLRREGNAVATSSLIDKEIRSLSGHMFGVDSVAFAPDGKTLASGGGDSRIILSNVADGTEIRFIKGSANQVHSVAFAPDGKTLASGGWDETIKLWNVADGTLIRTLRGHESPVNSVAFAPDGKTLASGSSDTTIKLWKVEDGTLIRSLEGHSSPVSSVAFSPDGKTLASGGDYDNSIKLWKVEDGTEIRLLNGHTNGVFSVAFAPDGKTLASGGIYDNSIKLWKVEDGTLIRTLNGHTSSVVSVAFSPDGKTLASGSNDITIKLWMIEDGTLIRTLNGHTSRVVSVGFSPDGETLASGSADSLIKLWQKE